MAIIRRNGWIIFLICGFFLYGCGEKESFIRQKLDTICASDLDTIVADLPKEKLRDSVYYTIISYKSYKEGIYSKMAIVDFYFLKDIPMKVTRKYRYYAAMRLWDRYYNVYTHFDDTAHAKAR